MIASKDDLEDALYRKGVGMMILNAANKIFVGQRLHNKEPAWQMPQGGIDPDEDLDQAMFRELQEEIGTRHVEIMGRSKTWHAYDHPPEIAKHSWGGKYKGQKQIWYALRFQGTDEEINIHTRHPEFRAWKWVTKEELVALIVPFKRDLYIRVLEDLWPYVEQNHKAP